MLDFGSFFNQPKKSVRKIGSKIKDKIKNKFTQENIERWFGVWDISGQVLYADIEEKMEKTMAQIVDEKKSHHFKINDDGSIDADYQIVED